MKIGIVVGLTLLATPMVAQLPAGWTGRADRGEATGIKFAVMGPGFHLTPGSSGIVYREADNVTGKFHTEATFTQTKASAHPEGYGLFFGGKDLAAEGQKYGYFLIRSDGKFLIKKRDGTATPNVVAWTDNEAVQKTDSTGKATNKLEIDATGDKILFKVNGKTVHEMDQADRSGIVGLRVNHGLDLHIAGFVVHKP